MTVLNPILVLCAILSLAACTSDFSPSSASSTRKAIPVSKGQMRINTIECNDFDDWYLDGYRVGKSFRSYKENLLNYRVDFCQNNLTKANLQRFKNNWQDGYQRGARENTGVTYKRKKR